MKRFIPLYLAIALAPVMASAQVIVDDSWDDGSRAKSGALDANWWYSTSSTAIEVGTGFLGLVSGGSGRGIHGTFESQSLSVGDRLTATFTFTTPATVGNNISTAFRAGFFDTTGKPGLAADLSASSGTPNAIYNNLNGYMTDMDVNTGATADIAIRERSNAASGQLLATTADYTSLGDSPDAGYSFLASTTYKGIFSIKRTAEGLELTSTLIQGDTELDSFTASDPSPSTSTFGMLAFHVGSSAFGSSSTVGAPNNGIDFTNIVVEYIPAPSIPTIPTITATVSGGNLNLSWPTNYVGWQLQVQTNALDVGLSNNWSAWPDSTTTNEVAVPIDTGNPSVFLRLINPPQP